MNYFEETTTESLGRYIILSYTYKLNSSRQKKEKNSYYKTQYYQVVRLKFQNKDF